MFIYSCRINRQEGGGEYWLYSSGHHTRKPEERLLLQMTTDFQACGPVM